MPLDRKKNDFVLLLKKQSNRNILINVSVYYEGEQTECKLHYCTDTAYT